MTYLLALSPLSLANDKEFKKLEFQTPSNKTNFQTRKLLEPVFPRFVEHSDLLPAFDRNLVPVQNKINWVPWVYLTNGRTSDVLEFDGKNELSNSNF